MDILFRRTQSLKSLSTNINFSLWAKIELSDEERTLVNRYKFDRSTLVSALQPTLLRNSILWGLFSLMISIPIIAWNFWQVIGLGWAGVVCVSAIIAFAVGFVMYHNKRETIYVKDLIHGRHFKCISVCELARKEAYLENICAYLRQVIESAKHWDGKEKREILALPKEEAKRAILSGPMF